MSRDLRTRLHKIEAAHPAPSLPIRDRWANVERGLAFDAALIASRFGGWRSGEDAIACLIAGLEKTRPGASPRCLMWSAQKAEEAHSGALGQWHTPERINAAFNAIGCDRGELLDGLSDLLDHADRIGDVALIRMAARREADALSDETVPAAAQSRGNSFFRSCNPTTSHTGSTS